MFTYVYYVCLMDFLSSISQSCFYENYISFTFMKICLKFICIFMYEISSDGLTKEGPSKKKIEGNFLVFQNKVISNKRKSHFVGSTL